MRAKHLAAAVAAVVAVGLLTAPAQAATAVVVAAQGFVRTMPQPRAPLVTVVGRGAPVWVSDEAVNGWRGVTLPDGLSGYISDQDLSVQGRPPPPPPPPALSPRRARPWIVRGELNVACRGCLDLFGGSVSDASSFALTLGRTLGESLGVEGTFGYSSGSATSSSANGTTKIDLSAGYTLMANLRWAPLRSASGHALTLAGGPFVLTGGAFGTVGFLHAEVAYEYRAPFALTLLVGFGGDLAVTDSSNQDMPCASAFLFSSCRRPFRRGDFLPTFRTGVGISF